jgi:uncharacterized protein YceH (UPF0502 family)
MEFPPLTSEEGRVLGALVEKALTTPDYYPLSLNALTNACNQLSNRDPVVTYSENTVLRAVEALRDKRLAFVFSGADSRVVKYGHKLADALALNRAETATLCVLLLRGPQTVGEIRGRTGRMHEFADLADAEAVLNGLAARPPDPLVVKLPRQPGCKESRYAHLLAGPVESAAAPEPPAAASPSPAPAPSVPTLPPADLAALQAEVAALRAEQAALRAELAELRRRFNDRPDPSK